MITAALLRTLTAGFALAALVAVTPVTGDAARAADATADTVQPGQTRASQLIGDPVYSASDQQLGRVVDLVLDPAGQVVGVIIGVPVSAGGSEKEVSVPMSDLRTATNRHLILDRKSEQLQEDAALQPDQSLASQMIGQSVEDADGEEVGQVVDIIVDPTGRVVGVIIGLVAPVGADEKNVSLPMKDLHSTHGHMTADRSKEQLRQAGNYRLDSATTGSGGSSDTGSDDGGSSSGK